METNKRKALELTLETLSHQRTKRKKIEEYTKMLESMKEREGMECEIFLGGSIAKGTDIRGSDIDIFLLFPSEFDPISVLRVLKKEFPSGKEEYSEHPYLIISQGSFSIDIVPGYRAPSSEQLKTAVDRTPFHVKFVKDNFTEDMKNEARLMKQFLKGIGAYGAESSIQGFSGYVAELIIFQYKSFEEAISNAGNWGIPFFLGEKSGSFNNANLIIVDPVDVNRNAAANVSRENLATFILASKLFSWDNWREFFFPRKSDFCLPENATVIYFSCRRCNEQVLIPNLRRIASVLKKELEELDFRVQYSSVFVNGGGYIVLIPEAESLGNSALHVGPPVTSGNVLPFLEKWGRGTKFGMPFMVGDRVCVLKERGERHISETIAELLPRIKTSRDFDPNKMLVITGKDLSSLPEAIRKCFISPSLANWIKSKSRDV